MSYLGGPGRDSKLVWIDLASDREVGSVAVPPGYYERISIAKDGKHAAVSRADSPVAADIWIVDLERGGATRLTNGPGANRQPLWSPDGTRIAYASDRNGITEFFARPPAGGAEETLLTQGAFFKEIDAWAPDGKSILYSQLDPETQRDLWILPLDGDRTPRPYIKSPFNEYFARISPDGRWASYISRETAGADMYVQSYPVPGEKYRITTRGVSFGGFLSNGRIGYAVPGDPRFYVVEVQTKPSFSTSAPRAVVTLPSDLVSGDILPDSSKLLASVPAERGSPASLTLVMNWALALKKR
jgi:Tol biopolymer transport system component